MSQQKTLTGGIMIYHFEASVLYDFYNTLLTDKQRDVIDLYYNDDLTMIEIADNLGISKQAVSNLVKSANNNLQKYEQDLHLAEMFYKVQSIKERLRKLANDGTLSKETIEEIKSIINEFESIER